MKVLVTGAKGQLGYDVVKEGEKRGLTMVGCDIDDFDLRNQGAVAAFVRAAAPDAVIHCAAYTAVDQAEREQELCYDVNVNGTKYVASVAAEVGAKLIYISTDYVFDGMGNSPHKVTEAKAPVNYYGLTKSLGEDAVASLLNRYFIVRISWVFGNNGNNFVKTMLRLGKEREEFSVVSDQIGAPTYTTDLASLLLDMVITEKYGVYHAANGGFCSWYDFAVKIMELSGLTVKVKPILTKDYPTAAKRPLNSRLDQNKLTENGFSILPPWEDALKRYLSHDA
ncbi:MAG TPA: dTDP-4-dehydrorhamnose reductase [Clostridiales bacterium]|nr:dTDP-4-dehydrorhamnose reductase [Clostridiales bacterium]